MIIFFPLCRLDKITFSPSLCRLITATISLRIVSHVHCKHIRMWGFSVRATCVARAHHRCHSVKEYTLSVNCQCQLHAPPPPTARIIILGRKLNTWSGGTSLYQMSVSVAEISLKRQPHLGWTTDPPWHCVNCTLNKTTSALDQAPATPGVFSQVPWLVPTPQVPRFPGR